jgi:hypothetical protein
VLRQNGFTELITLGDKRRALETVVEPNTAWLETFLAAGRNRLETEEIQPSTRSIGRADHVVGIIDRRLSSQRSGG